MKKISDEEWERINKEEAKAWKFDRSFGAILGIEDAYPRHSPVMLLDRDPVREMSICDIGGGPISILLHYQTEGSWVVDPLEIPEEFIDNYLNHNIVFVQQKAEDFLDNFSGQRFDEVWIYNTLQHVQDVNKILSSLHLVAPVLRISEPCNYPPDRLHPHSFTPESLWELLDKISIRGDKARVDYDYPYVGGRFELK